MLGIISACVGAVVGAIGGALGTISAFLAPTMLALIGVDKIVGLVISLASKLGLIEKEKEIKEMGDKFLQSEENGIVLDKFDDWEDYKKAVNEYKVDEVRSAQINEDEKKVAGLAFLIKDIEYLTDFEIGDLLVVLKDQPDLLEDKKILELVSDLKNSNLKVEDLKNFYKGELDIDSSNKIEKILENVKEK